MVYMLQDVDFLPISLPMNQLEEEAMLRQRTHNCWDLEYRDWSAGSWILNKLEAKDLCYLLFEDKLSDIVFVYAC